MTKAAELAKMGEVLTNSQIGGRRNIVINGACQVAQRATSATGLGGSAPGYTTVDRWQLSVGATSAGRFSTAQVAVTDLPGFANAFHLDCTTADTSIAAGEVLKIDYKIEGQDLQQLKKGTSSAEKVTVSFYMKTNKAFTFMCELDDRDNNRRNGQQFTTTTDWTRHVLTFAGDTTGTLDDDNALSMVISFFFHAGSDFTGGTYSANTWESRASSDNMRAVGIGSFFDSTDNDIKITGLQMEVGSQATPFEHRSFGEEQELCKRYFQKVNNLQCIGTTNTSERLRINATLVPVMRAGPSFTIISGVVTKFIGGETAVFSADTSIAQSGQLGAAAIQVDIDNFSTNSNGDGGGTTPVDNACFLGHLDQFIYECSAEL